MVASLETVSLYYYLDHQPSNRQHKINGFGTAAHTVTNVKVTNDMRQTITLPWDADIDKANVAVIKSKVYDIVDIRAATLAGNKSMELDLIYNPVSTMMKSGDTVYGMWERTPSCLNKGVKFDIGEDRLKSSRAISLPYIPYVYGSGEKAFYVEIATKQDILSGTESSDVNLYGYFCPVSTTYNPLTAGGTAYHASPTIQFPTLNTIINDIEYATDIPSDSIISVSISPRCPWKYRTVAHGSFNSEFEILDNTDTKITIIKTSEGFGCIPIHNKKAKYSADYTTAQTAITLTDFERYCGAVVVEDERGNDIGEIPTEWFNSSNQLTYYCYAVSDVTGIHTVVQFGTNEIILKEGQLPWVGDAYYDYMARNYQYDREMLANNVRNIENQRNIDMATSIANGALNTVYAASVGGMSGGGGGRKGGYIGAGVGIASTAINTIATAAKAQADIGYIRETQRINQRNAKRQLSNNYQLSEGVNYMLTAIKLGGAKIRIDTPANMTATDFNNYIAYRGWPCGKYASFSLTTGCLQGEMYSTPNDTYLPRGNGPEMDMLREMISKGVRLV